MAKNMQIQDSVQKPLAASTSTMTIKQALKLAIPKAGINHFIETYMTWFSVGFVSSFVAGGLDKYAGVAYASYYTGAVNEAVGFKFWVLLSVIGLLLFCLSLPLVYGALKFNRFEAATTKLRQFTYTFFLVAFDEGALMIGILVANCLHASDRTAMLASKSFLFSGVGVLSITALALFNSLLWLIGEAIFNREDKSYSGIVGLIMTVPPQKAAPAYLIGTAIVIYLVMSQ
jgi:hypothetical protein